MEHWARMVEGLLWKQRLYIEEAYLGTYQTSMMNRIRENRSIIATFVKEPTILSTLKDICFRNFLKLTEKRKGSNKVFFQ